MLYAGSKAAILNNLSGVGGKPVNATDKGELTLEELQKAVGQFS